MPDNLIKRSNGSPQKLAARVVENVLCLVDLRGVSRIRLVLVFLGLLLGGAVARGQTTFGTVLGTVTDATGAAVVGAKVVLTSQDTNQTHTMESGTGGTYSFVNGKNAWLGHSAPEAGLMLPSAGYTFAWRGFTGLNDMGVRVAQIPLPWLGLETIRTEGEMAFDQQVVSSDLGYFFSGIVQ